MDDDAVFCEKCGKMIARKAVSEAEPDQGTVSAGPVQLSVSEEPDSAEKKKKTSLSVIARICIAAVAAAAVLFVRGRSGPQEQLPSVLSQNNFHNGAIFAFDDNRIYFYASNEEQNNKTVLYSQDYEQKDEKILSENDKISKIRIADGKLMYSTADYDENEKKYTLEMMNPDGTEEAVRIIESSTFIDVFDKAGEDIYYLTENKLHRCNPEGKEDAILLSDVTDFFCAGKVIYYTTENEVFSFDRKKEESTKLVDGSVSELCLDEGKLYYLKDSALYTYDLKDAKEKKLADLADSHSMLISGGVIYLIRHLETDELESLLRGVEKEVFLSLIGGGYLRVVSAESGHVEDHKNAYCGVALFAYPQGVYFRYSYFLNLLADLKDFQ